MVFFGFVSRLHPWKFSFRFEDGHPWRWITGRLGLEESFKGVKVGSTVSANFVKGTGWGRVFDFMDEVLNEH